MKSRSNTEIVDISLLDGQDRLQAAKLAIESLPAYYKVDGINDNEMNVAVSSLLGKSGSDTEKGFVAYGVEGVIGIMTFLDSEQLPLARLLGAQALIKELGSTSGKLFRAHLRGYDAGFGPVPRNSNYLSRFAIDESHRGSGLASKLMTHFLSMGKQVQNDLFSLHVDHSNDRAIAFYRKHGFSIYEQGKGTRYLSLSKNHSNLLN